MQAEPDIIMGKTGQYDLAEDATIWQKILFHLNLLGAYLLTTLKSIFNPYMQVLNNL